MPEWGEENEDEASYGIDDPNWCWVLVINSSKTDVRFVRVRDSSGAILIPTIDKHVVHGSVIVTDLCGG